MTEIQSYSNLLSVILSTQGLQMNGQHCLWLHWFLLGNEVRFLSIACSCNLFISLAMKMLFFIVIINGFNAQSPAPGLYLSRCAKNIPKRSRLNLNLNFSMITFITEKALRYLLSFVRENWRNNT